MTINLMLINFMDSCDNTVGLLNSALREEAPLNITNNGGMGFVSNWCNHIAADAVDQLYASAIAINRKFQEDPATRAFRLNDNFSGAIIRQREKEEWNLMNTLFSITRASASFQTAAAISNVLDNVRQAEEQAYSIYNQLNPDNPRKTPCCREAYRFCAVL